MKPDRETREADEVSCDDPFDKIEAELIAGPSGDVQKTLELIRQVDPQNIAQLERHIGELCLNNITTFAKALEPLAPNERRAVIYLLVQEISYSLIPLQIASQYLHQKK